MIAQSAEINKRKEQQSHFLLLVTISEWFELCLKSIGISFMELCHLNLFRYEGGSGLKTIVLERDIHTTINREELR
jgi:hypothetical protein